MASAIRIYIVHYARGPAIAISLSHLAIFPRLVIVTRPRDTTYLNTTSTRCHASDTSRLLNHTGDINKGPAIPPEVSYFSSSHNRHLLEAGIRRPYRPRTVSVNDGALNLDALNQSNC
jgi:hypothetical protein